VHLAQPTSIASAGSKHCLMLDDPGLYPEQNKTYSRNCWFRTFLEAIKCLLPRPHQPSLTAISQSSQSLSGGLKCVHHFACIYSQIVIIHSIHISYCIPRYEYPQVSPKDWYIYIYWCPFKATDGCKQAAISKDASKAPKQSLTLPLTTWTWTWHGRHGRHGRQHLLGSQRINTNYTS